MSQKRHATNEKLMAATREQIPTVAIPWLAAVRKPLEILTKAALSGQITNEQFAALVREFSASLPGLLEKMDTAPLADLLETGMGAAMANGITARQNTLAKAKLPWETDAWLASKGKGKGKKCGNSYISSSKECRPKYSEGDWEGSPKEMQKRATALLKVMPTMQHPSSGVEMQVTADGIRKTLGAMTKPHEFMAATKMVELFLHSQPQGPIEPHRTGNYHIEGFQRYRADFSIRDQSYTAEIISKKLRGQDTHHLKQFRLIKK